MDRKAFYAAILGTALATVPFASAQDAPPQGGQDGNRGQGRQRFDPEQMRQRMAERMKEQLGVNDEEWSAMQPLVEKVQRLQMQSRAGGRGFGGRGFGGQGAPGADAQSNPVAKASGDLQTLLENKDDPPRPACYRAPANQSAFGGKCDRMPACLHAQST